MMEGTSDSGILFIPFYVARMISLALIDDDMLLPVGSFQWHWFYRLSSPQAIYYWIILVLIKLLKNNSNCQMLSGYCLLVYSFFKNTVFYWQSYLKLWRISLFVFLKEQQKWQFPFQALINLIVIQKISFYISFNWN